MRVNNNHVSYCLSVANKVCMMLGELNYKNVVQVLTQTSVPTPHPVGISIPRFAAMVMQANNYEQSRREESECITG